MKPRKIEDILKEDLKDYVSELDVKSLWADIEEEVDAVVAKPKSGPDSKLFVVLGLSLFICAAFFLFKNQNENSSFALEEEGIQIERESEEKDILVEKNSIQGSLLINSEKEKAIFEKPGTTDIYKNTIVKESNLNTAFHERSVENSNQNELFFENKKINEVESFAIGKGINNLENSLDINTKIIKTDILPFVFTEILSNNSNFVDSTFLKIENLLNSGFRAQQNESEDYRRKPDFQFSTGIYGGASLALRDLSDKSGENTDYLQVREDTETSLETLQTGLKIAVEHKSGIALQTGFQFMQLTEKFEFSGSRIRRDTIEDGIFAYLINPNGDTIPVYDQIINTQEINTQKLEYNRYRFLDIPFSAAYFIGDDDWSVGVQAGVVLNLALKTEGEIFDSMGDIQKIEETNFFKSNVGLSYRGAVSGRYLINDNLQLEATVHGRYFPKTFTKSSYHLNQKYTVVGLDVGLNYLF